MGLLPAAWCGSGPRSCAKSFAIVELTLSMIGLIIVICLPMILLNFHDEVVYIKQFRSENKSTDSEHGAAVKKEDLFFILKTPFTLRGLYYCETYKQMVHDWLHAFLPFNSSGDSKKIKFTVAQNNSRMESNGKEKRTYCVIDVYTPEDPERDIVKVEGKIYSMKNIVGLCLSNQTEIGLKPKELEKMMVITTPQASESFSTFTYPGGFSDPAKYLCIAKNMAQGDANEIENAFYTMHGLLFASAVFSIVLAFFVLKGAGSKISKTFLYVTFGLEWIPILLLIIAIFYAISPNLCLMEYGGISPNAISSPEFLQTVIGYTSGIYLVSYKGYLLWYLLAYTVNMPQRKERRQTRYKPKPKKQTAAVVEIVAPAEEGTSGSEDKKKVIVIKEAAKPTVAGKTVSTNNNKLAPAPVKAAAKDSKPVEETSGEDDSEDDDEDGDDDGDEESGFFDLLAFTKKKRNRRSRATTKASSKTNKGALGLGRFGNKFW